MLSLLLFRDVILARERVRRRIPPLAPNDRLLSLVAGRPAARAQMQFHSALVHAHTRCFCSLFERVAAAADQPTSLSNDDDVTQSCLVLSSHLLLLLPIV